MTRIAVTGTPGVGKTRLAAEAAAAGWRVIDVKKWAREAGCVVGHDDEDGADVIDIDRLRDLLPPDEGGNVLYESHLSHLLGLEAAWVVRCDPDVLRERLEARGYRQDKVVENLEAEAMDLILQEALDQETSSGAPTRIIQRDGTRRNPAELFAAFVDAQEAELNMNDLESVDWSDRLPIG